MAPKAKISSWDEVVRARQEQRRELVLTGAGLAQRLEQTQGNIDLGLFGLNHLNFLDLSACTKLDQIPDALGRLSQLTSLVLSRNALTSLPEEAFGRLQQLKMLDVSGNQLERLPNTLAQLPNLATLNASHNRLKSVPSLEAATHLAHLDVGSNQLEDLLFALHPTLTHLADVTAPRNKVAALPGTHLAALAALKKLDLSENALTAVPGELAECLKLKELVLGGNPLKDNRLKKMVAQKGTKAVLDYIRQNCPKGDAGGEGAVAGGGGKKGGKGKKGKKGMKEAAEAAAAEEQQRELSQMLEILHLSGARAAPRVVADDLVKDVRPFIVCCVVRHVDLSGPNLKKFIQLQTRLHDSVCEKRNAATIATHDLHKMLSEGRGELRYMVRPPAQLKIVPLGQTRELTATQLVTHLRDEAEAYRKEKKRNTISGVHQYLNLLNNLTEYACLVDAEQNRVLSFPPITNSDLSKISESTTDVFVEVTSSTKLQAAKNVADTLLREMLLLGLGKMSGGDDSSSSSSSSSEDEDDSAAAKKHHLEKYLQVEQVKIVDTDGYLKVVYPAKTDLAWKDKSIAVKR